MANLIKQKTTAIAVNKLTVFLLALFILAAAGTYIYLANMTVRTLTVLEKTKSETQSLSVEVSEMESRRLAFENNITTKHALQRGLVEVKNPTFIIKSSEKASLSLKVD